MPLKSRESLLLFCDLYSSISCDFNAGNIDLARFDSCERNAKPSRLSRKLLPSKNLRGRSITIANHILLHLYCDFS